MTQHDGSELRLRKLAQDYDATDRIKAMNYLQERAAAGVTSSPDCFMSTPNRPTCTSISTPSSAPLNQLAERELCPGAIALERINAGTWLTRLIQSFMVSMGVTRRAH